MPDVAVVSSLVSLAVAAAAAVMALLAVRAQRRSGNGRLRFVAAAFGIFVVKSVFSAYNVWTHLVPHDLIELTLSLLDLATLAVLFLPFVVRAPR